MGMNNNIKTNDTIGINNDIKMNKNMKKLILDTHSLKGSKAMINIEDLLMVSNPLLKEIHNCIVIDNANKLSESEIKFENINGDRTGFEASENEVLLNSFIFKQHKNCNEVLKLGLFIVELWVNKLRNIYPERCFIVILSSCDGNVFLRFHQKRNDEISWLSDDIEGYQDAVAFIET